MRKGKKKSVVPIYVLAGSWLVCAILFPMYKLWAIIVSIIITATLFNGARQAANKKAAAAAAAEPEPEPEPEKAPEAVSYGPEIDAIIAEGKLAQREMARLYNAIREPAVRMKISQLMQVSDKIVEDAIHDPSDVPQIKKFLSYYLPTTIKLLNAYDRMGAQGIQGENISGTMSRIEDMLDTAVAAYHKQLDSLFANQALDIETDIAVMNSMLSREGLAEKDF